MDSHRLAYAGVKAIESGVYTLPPLPALEKFPPEFRPVLLKLTSPQLQVMRIEPIVLAADGSALVFAHAILDELATECCQIFKTADPLACRENVIKKQVTLEELETASFEQVYRRLVEEYLDSLGRSKSLMERLSLLHTKCPPQRERSAAFRFLG